MSTVIIPQDWPVDEWYGFKRHHFVVDGCNAWIVEPTCPAPDGRWTWTTQWAEAFVPRVGTVALLEHGFYHAHVDVYKYRASAEGIRVMRKFQDELIGLGLSPKANLIGMSWGGYFSMRYTIEHPEGVCAVYLDAPVTDASDADPSAESRLKDIMGQYGMTRDELAAYPGNPVNAAKALIEANVPFFATISMADQTVLPQTNFEVLEARLKDAGAKITYVTDEMLTPEQAEKTFADTQGSKFYIFKRDCWGHHPHGFDDVRPLLLFHWNARK
ncbi:MAG: alpha/beta hydrolase [Lentisphaeria bacterium]|nr:alpha/beta hydrolase [Lentisphaeria bacterium]